MKREWTIVLVTDTGRELRHFVAMTRQEAREQLRTLVAQAAPRKARARIRANHE